MSLCLLSFGVQISYEDNYIFIKFKETKISEFKNFVKYIYYHLCLKSFCFSCFQVVHISRRSFSMKPKAKRNKMNKLINYKTVTRIYLDTAPVLLKHSTVHLSCNAKVIKDKNSLHAITEKRKLGRPPGKRKVRQSPKTIKGSSSKKRKVQPAKPPTARKKLNTSDGQEKRQNSHRRASNSREVGSSSNSDNQPLCKMIPAISKRRMDFRNPSPLGP